MRIILSLIFLFAHAAQAFQFGTGMSPGMQCPYPYGPSNAAYQGDDEIRNLVGGLNNAERKLERQDQKLRALTAEINAAKAKIKRVIKSASAMSEIERHYKYKANPGDYSQACGRRERGAVGERTASAGGQGANLVHRPSRHAPAGNGEEDPGRYAVPSEYCQGGENSWQEVVAEDGMVLDAICDYEVPFSRNRPDEGRSAECRDGLNEYYAKQAKREALEAEVRALKDKVNAFNENKERISDQIAEGTYCPYCNSQRRGQNSLGTGNFAMMGVSILGALFNRQQQRPPPQIIAVPRRGPPNMLPYGGNRAPAALPFPGPSAYPGRPYAAPIPGYGGIQPGGGPGQGFYGGAPGGIGQGSFGCQGTSPYSFGNPLAPQFAPFQNGQSNPFANPYANDPFAAYGNQNQFGQHPLLNPGYGPGIAPFLGNGVPGYGQNPYQNDPFNQYGQNFGAPGALPFPGGQQSPFGQNPYAPYGNPYGGPPGALPYPNNWYPNGGYGMNNAPYALPYGSYGNGNGNFGLGGPGVLPYVGGNSAPYATNMPYLGGGSFNPAFGAPYGINPVQNYGYQMNQLRQGVSQIGGGLYGGAPAIMPYIGSPAPLPTPIPIPTNPIPSRTPTNGTAPGIVPAR